MKKSLFKILILNFILIFSFVYLFNINIRSNVYAEEEVIEHKHEDDETAVYQPWSDPKSLPKTTGYYYLTCDIKWDYPWEPEGDVHLCLNGHGIKRTGIGYVIRTTSNCKLCISDCNSINQVHKYKVTDGGEKIGLAVVDDTLTENYETFSGGYITGGRGVTEGGAIVLDGLTTNEVQFKMTGGTIIGNYTTGNGAAIACNVREEDKTCKAEVSNVNIIGNVAPDGHSAAIYYDGTNSSLTLSNVNISNNISSDIPAGIKNTGTLKLKDKIYIYDNKTSNDKEADITINSDNNTHSLTVEELSEDSKIGYYQINCSIIDYYKYNLSKDINKIFISNTYQLLEREENNGVFRKHYSDDYSVVYDGEYHTLVLNPSLDGLIDTITYGDKKGSYYSPRPSQYKEVGEYHIYYKLTTYFETVEGEQKITILDTRFPIGRNDLYYTGEVQELVTLEDYPDVSYTYKMEGGYWSNYIPKGLDVGEYIINVRVYDEVKLTISESQIKASIKSIDTIPLLDEINASTLYYESILEKYYPIAEDLKLVIDEATEERVEKEKITIAMMEEEISKLQDAVSLAKENCAKVDDIIGKIDSIGEITLDSKDLIDEAFDAYDNLENKYKRLITNYFKLFSYKAFYITLVAETEKINYVIEKIDDIGEVAYNEESKAKIDAAKEAYAALTDTQKTHVSNYETLTTAEATYSKLRADKDVAIAVESIINEIGEVAYNEESKAKIDAAKEAYAALTDDQKPLVSNYETITTAEATYSKLRADKDAAIAVESKINEIGEVSYNEESKAKIDAAKEAYAALSTEQKLLVSNASILSEAISKYALIRNDKDRAEATDAKIEAIGAVVYDKRCKTKIDEAKASYNVLTEAQKAFVTKYDNLVKAEKTYLNVEEVYKTIELIGAVELNSKSNEKIIQAKAAYSQLSDEEKKLVTNSNRLAAAETQYSMLSQERDHNIFMILVISGSSLAVITIVLIYVLMFFKFNSWTLIRYKQKRVFRFGHKGEKVRLLRMNFRIVYRDEADVHRRK